MQLHDVKQKHIKQTKVLICVIPDLVILILTKHGNVAVNNLGVHRGN